MIKKNFISYIFILIVLFLVGRVDVYAAQTLTCLYEKSNGFLNVDKVVLIQDENGNKFLYKNDKDVKISDAGWKISNDFMDFSSVKLSSDNTLTKCPASKHTKKDGSGKVIFYDSTEGASKLITAESSNTVNKPNTISAGKSDAPKNDTSSMIGRRCDEVDDSKKWVTSKLGSGFVGACLYQAQTEYGCHTIELNIGNNTFSVEDSWNGSFNASVNGMSQTFYYGFTIDPNTMTYDKIKSVSQKNGCPGSLDLVYTFTFETNGTGIISYNSKNANAVNHLLVDTRGKNVFTGDELVSNPGANIGFTPVEFKTCEDLLGGSTELVELLKGAVILIKILIPIILLVMGSLDFVQGIFAQSDDVIKKAQQKFIKRLIIAVVIFLIPSALKVFLTISHEVWDFISPDLCGIL